MGFFGKSFEEKVEEALEEMRGMGLGVRGLTATVDDKVVTLMGEADNMEAKTKIITIFNEKVDADNVLNTIRLKKVAPPVAEVAPAVAEAAEAAPVVEATGGEKTYEVVSGDTLGHIAKRFYGNAGKYMKIFEANRDILDDPNMIKVGQKLRIPE